ncbi:sensor histidine kinase [Symbioplanes lichenis]|uniref:sensor histidine kinase n=1 Tax=Symbioplanes lichenis TaxID=1629072 RepID=UPI002738B913|nr:HAMP domain-containing sensor histidine kinase [Actinoplanes lichenis]
MTKTPGKRAVALAAAVLTLGLGAGAAAAIGLTAAGRDAATARLELRVAGVRGALDTTTQRYADTLHDVAVTAASGGALATAVSRLTADRLPGAHQIVVVSPTGAILAEHTLDGSSPPPRTVLAPPPALARALETARTTGRPAAGPAHVLPADLDLPPAHRQSAIDLVAPVHDTEFRGWVVIAVRAGDLLRESLGPSPDVAVTLTETSAGGVTHRVASYGEASGAETRTVDVALAGHAWQAEVRPATALAPFPFAAPLALIAAAVVSLLLAGAVLRLAAARRAPAAVATGTDDAEVAGFTKAASEHLRAPLHTIAGFTELLHEEAGAQLDEASRGFLDRIGGSTRRMLTLVDELVAYSSAGDAALKPVPVDLTALTLGVALAHPDRPAVDVGDLPTVLADADLLADVLGRLVDNAARYVRHDTAPRITVGARQHAPGWWRVEIADRGIGVPADERARVFRPFHRTAAAEGYPGIGLGLATARRIITAHGGEIGVEPNPGGGSVFWFTVPATDLTPEFGPELFATAAQ